MSTTAPYKRITTYHPTAATTVFEALFPVFGNDDLSVFLDGDERTDFTVSATYVEGVSSDAKVVLAVGIVGRVDIVSLREPHRTNRFGPGPIPVRDFNLALDTLESEVQEARRDVDRAHKAPFGSEGGVFRADQIESAQVYAEQAASSVVAAQQVVTDGTETISGLIEQTEDIRDEARSAATDAQVYAEMVGAAVYDFNFDSDPTTPGYDWNN